MRYGEMQVVFNKYPLPLIPSSTGGEREFRFPFPVYRLPSTETISSFPYCEQFGDF